MLAFKTILHATDFSESSNFAFGVACALARDYGARLIVLHVAPPLLGYYGEGAVIPAPQDYEASLMEDLEQVKPTDPWIHVEHRLVEGDAAGEILRQAKETKADVIVMGTHGRTGLSRLVMGSVAEVVVRKSSCPVLTVKNPVPEASLTTAPSPATAVEVTAAQ
jgi:nucleotide-binding universal stress UspA family protein